MTQKVLPPIESIVEADLSKDQLSKIVLTQREARFILMCRHLRFGTIEDLTIHEGQPMHCRQVERKVDFNRPIVFEPKDKL